MVTSYNDTIRTAKDIVFEWLDAHPEARMSEAQHALQSLKKSTVKGNYYRWHDEQQGYNRRSKSKSPLPRGGRPHTHDGRKVRKPSARTPSPSTTKGKRRRKTGALPDDLQHIKDIMEGFNSNPKTQVRFGEIAAYLEKTNSLNIVAEGVTQSLKHMNNDKLLSYIRPIQDSSESSQGGNSEPESLASMSSSQRLSYLTNPNRGSSTRSRSRQTRPSTNASSSEPEEEAKHSTC